MKPLQGEVQISGAKNAAVAIMPAALLVEGKCILENAPAIKDVSALVTIMGKLGAKISYIDENTLDIDSSGVDQYQASYEMVKTMRASYYLLGALLGRFKKAEVSLPGGCDFGYRPIDQHIKGFEALGAKVEIEHGIVKIHAERLLGTQIYLDVVSVGATVNLMLAASLAEGTTVLENAAKEPHVVDVANFINAMGGNVKGAGTDVIKIKGVEKLTGGRTHAVIPDMIEAGTYMLAAAATKGNVLVKNVIPKHLESLTAKLIEMNVKITEYEDSIRVECNGELHKASIKTLPYPGFPTDLHPQASVLLCLAQGASTVTEGVWDSRFQYVDELKRMGANAKVEGRMAIFEGVSQLSGAPVTASDLRAGAAMVVAGLAAEGQTEISNLKYIDRGYEKLEEKLRGLGADIRRASFEE